MTNVRTISWLKGAKRDFETFPTEVQIDAQAALTIAARGGKAAEGTTLMNDDEFELVRGSGNVFRDMGNADAEVLQLKAILAGKIIEVLDEQEISVRRAHELTGFAAADFSRVRQAKLQRFTVDRLMQMLAKLNQDVDVSVSIRPRSAAMKRAG
jgi:predicted XRE-type DNA-binding protein